jgi:hypothetical protein
MKLVSLITICCLIGNLAYGHIVGGGDIASLDPRLDEPVITGNEWYLSNPYKVIAIKKEGVSFLYENEGGNFSVIFVKDNNLTNLHMESIYYYLKNN